MAAIIEKIFHYHTKRGLRSRLLQWKKGDREADRPPFCQLFTSWINKERDKL